MPYISSDSEYNRKTVPGGISLESKDPDYVNEWINVPLEKEIWHGRKLREEKLLSSKKKSEYDVVNIDFLGTICGEDQWRKRKGNRKYHKIKKTASNLTSTFPFARQSSSTSAYSPNNRMLRTGTQRMKAKQKKKCSMRIAELAVPSKRQCIDTWRNKAYILPEFMVERLKQHVLDQRPIVKIPEAIYCFQQRRTRQSPQNFLQNNNNINEILLKPLRQMDTKTLSIIFGYKIARRLSNPLNLTISSKWESLSKIVSKDIAQLMKCHTKFGVEYQQNKWIHTDVSNKITVWIVGILEDLSYKLLEEDLRELEEEEGPVLDFIDELIDNVLNICEPPAPRIIEDSDTSDSSKYEVIGEESENGITPTASMGNANEEVIKDALLSITEDGIDSENIDVMLTDSEHFRNELLTIVANINKEFGNDMITSDLIDIENESYQEMLPKGVAESDENYENTGAIKNNNSQEMTPKPEIEEGEYTENANSIDKEDIQEETSETDNNEYDENTEQTDDQLENQIQNEDEIEANNNDEKYDSNVSEVFETFTEDSGMVNPDSSNKQKTSTMGPESDSQIHSNATNNNFKPSVIFAEPNRHLLSDADESWPASLKISSSINKSGTSLKNILEYDEKQVTPTEDHANMTNTQDSSYTTIDKIHIGSQTTEISNKISKETKTAATGKISATDVELKTRDGFLVAPKLIEDEMITKSSELIRALGGQPTDKSSIKDKYETIEQKEERNTFSRKTQSQISYDWKVHLHTAPSWVTSFGCDRGEPSEDSIPIQLKSIKVREIELRKWCRDLEKAYINLEMWSEWIQKTCKETAFLLKRKGTLCSSINRKSPTDWTRLKKNINKDAVLWTKLYQRTEDNFKRLKRKYGNIEILPAEYSAMCTCNKTKTRLTTN